MTFVENVFMMGTYIQDVCFIWMILSMETVIFPSKYSKDIDVHITLDTVDIFSHE